MTSRLRPFFYGVADMGPAAVDIFLKVYLLLYFNVILGLSPSLTSLAIGLGVLWDALLDPWIGVYSDRYYRKNRHRKNLIYSAVLITTVLFFVLWRIPVISEAVTFGCLFLISSLLNSAISLFSVPYIAVANDLEHDNEKRKIWTGWRLAFFNFGSLLGLVVPAYFLTSAQAGHAAEPYKQATWVLCAVLLICSCGSLFLVYHKKESEPLIEGSETEIRLLSLLKDKIFLRLNVSYFVVNCGLGLNSALALYYYKGYLGFTESQTQIVLVAFLAVFTLSIPLWIFLTRHFDKRKLIIAAAFVLGVQTMITFPQFKGVNFWVIAALASGLGGILVGVAVVLEIYLSDFLKDKQLETRQNVSGQYLGIWKMSAKISRAIAIVLAGPILEKATDTQALANYFGWAVGLFFIFSALVMAVPVRKETQ